MNHTPEPEDYRPLDDRDDFRPFKDRSDYRKCVSCGERKVSEHPGGHSQYENALMVNLIGGYGMFIDPMDSGPLFILCHECTHDLIDKLPWLSKILGGGYEHSHTSDYVRDNPDHFGWDYDETWTHRELRDEGILKEPWRDPHQK